MLSILHPSKICFYWYNTTGGEPMININEAAKTMVKDIIADNMPQKAVVNALASKSFVGKKLYMIAIGKAAWTMAKAASDYLGDKIETGIVITKYDHSMGDIPRVKIFEAGHPIPDENTVAATSAVLALAENLGEDDEVLFLVSGGGSALFEAPQDGVKLEDLAAITNKLLASGAGIVEINMIRKRLSKVKAGRFAALVSPASIFQVVLSDVLGDRLDAIASGPAAPDASTSGEAFAIAEKYGLELTPLQAELMHRETPKTANNVETVITGSVSSLCEAAAASAKALGLTPYVLTTSLDCQAAEAGKFLAAIARDTQRGVTHFSRPCAIIAGGETVVKITGNGLGGRNQEMALSAAMGIAGLENTIIFAIGSDGTDGPTDAAGGLVDGETMAKLAAQGISIEKTLANNDSYHALKAAGGLIITGPTGTNVNDVAVILCM